MSRDDLAARIRVKQEAREQQQEESVNSVEAAKRKLASLTNSISLGKQAESPRAADPPSYQQQQQLAASVEQITPRNQEILKQLMVSSSNGQPQTGQGAPQQQQSAPQALNIASLAQGAILRHIQQSSHSQQQMQVQQQQQQQQHSQQAQQQRQVQVVQQQQQPGAGMTPSPQLQQLVRMHAPPAAAVAAVQHPSMARVQMQMQVVGSASPPVLHIPEAFNQNFNNQVAASYANTVQTVRGPCHYFVSSDRSSLC